MHVDPLLLSRCQFAFVSPSSFLSYPELAVSCSPRGSRMKLPGDRPLRTALVENDNAKAHRTPDRRPVKRADESV